ncbi:CBS domain-containing protein [Salimicrobium jeotgali]|uniref:CBS domain-containing protein n=2 Tax=Salimicrobium TaxID=351195 RepID=K2GBD4_9BACI|nr:MULTISPECIES: CBS domain-containing protein [Salimicrobium]AKG05242.1 CBS domain-containing protein [Salimicrobium jeotgali]EKE32373.1 hypothetical protein MJ3_03012 [Salimicrobium jeotgali]MBM7695650.1 CBS domain-containing protein [Salimicrobium jeotgali]SIS75389.1 CBS domain-containing protein [Salimicrobium salexigens]
MPELKNYMNTEVVACEASDTLTTIAKRMKEEEVGFVVITEQDKYAGVITDRDIVVNGLAKGSAENVKASDIMTDKVVTATSDMEVQEAARLMQDHQIRRLLVVDEDKVSGVVSIGDIGLQGSDEIAGYIMGELSKGSANN